MRFAPHAGLFLSVTYAGERRQQSGFHRSLSSKKPIVRSQASVAAASS